MEDYKICEPLKIRRLEDSDRISNFDCGDEDLNDFIINESFLYKSELLAVSYVIEDQCNKILAYFSLANDKISITEFENNTEFNRFKKRFKNSKRLKSYPAAKLCRLAVDKRVHHLHLGSKLLNFIKGYFIHDNKTGCRFITVDAYIQAIPFYKRNNFVELTNNDKDASHTRLLYYDLKMMRKE